MTQESQNFSAVFGMFFAMAISQPKDGWRSRFPSGGQRCQNRLFYLAKKAVHERGPRIESAHGQDL